MSREYRLLAIDLDGTLLQKSNRITKATVCALRRITNEGIHVVITTGRPLFHARAIGRPFLKSDSYIIASNGASVYSGALGKYLHRESFTLPQIQSIMSFANHYGYAALFSGEKGMYTNDLITWLRFIKYQFKLPFRSIFDITKIRYLSKAEKIKYRFAPGKEGLEKCQLFYMSPEHITLFRETLNSTGQFELIFSPYNSAEITVKGANKGTALGILADHLGILPEEIVAVGDGLNDRTMIEYAGLGVAVANGAEGLKNVADYICPGSTNDSVLHVIEKYFS